MKKIVTMMVSITFMIVWIYFTIVGPMQETISQQKIELTKLCVGPENEEKHFCSKHVSILIQVCKNPKNWVNKECDVLHLMQANKEAEERFSSSKEKNKEEG